MPKPMKHQNLRAFTMAAVLSALIIVMTVIPYTGYIYYGLIEITTLHIVVAIGGVLLGWKYGAWLGFVWGATCVIRAFTNPLWAPFTNPLISLVPRVIVGAVAGFAAAGLRKAKCKPYVVGALSAAAATLTNTVLVLSALKLFSAIINGSLIETIYMTLIGVNGLIELGAAIIIVPAVLAALQPRELVLGIDFGASATKLALVKNGRCLRTLRKEDTESLEAAIQRLGAENAARIAITGVGSASVQGDILSLPTKHADEFASLSRGASHLAKRPNCLVVSLGTGTSFVRVTPFRSWHVGGTGLGGGTMQSLAARLCGVTDMDEFSRLAQSGDLSHVDLQLKDVCAGVLPDLTPTSTVANLAKTGANVTREDLAAGLCNLVFESIGVMAAFAVKKRLTRSIVLVGTISDWPAAARSLDEVAALHHVRFIVPEHAPFAVAIGAAMEN